MLLPDNIHPELSIYYNASLLIEELKKNDDQLSILQLFSILKSRNEMSFSTFLLCLDWLYLINIAKVDERGNIKICL